MDVVERKSRVEKSLRLTKFKARISMSTDTEESMAGPTSEAGKSRRTSLSLILPPSKAFFKLRVDSS